eukprot:1160198-Pelagomonas_calceolata.AAC.2
MHGVQHRAFWITGCCCKYAQKKSGIEKTWLWSAQGSQKMLTVAEMLQLVAASISVHSLAGNGMILKGSVRRQGLVSLSNQKDNV